MIFRLLVPFVLFAALSSCSMQHSRPREDRPSGAMPFKLATWNLEFLAENDAVGCQPRAAADYAAMRRIADDLDADVVAFQEAENAAAAARVFDPSRYVIVMEGRAGNPSGNCGGRHPEQRFIRQAVGFAIRKGIAFDRNLDVTSLQLGDPQLRSGVDITLRPRGRSAIRLLGIHLKSGCFTGSEAKACPVLQRQVPALETWIDSAAIGPVRFAVLGDWNRRLALAHDPVWSDIDDAAPANSDLRLADDGISPACDPRFGDFIDHIVLDRRAGMSMQSFIEVRYGIGEKH
jgi:hypothetical protein